MKKSEAIYNEIGKGYNATRRADPFIAETLYRLLLPGADGVYLDAGCGTGNYTVALAEKGVRFYGVDPSARMLDIAREHDSFVQWAEATAEKLPFENDFLNGAIATLTLHHWASLDDGFAELYRVLKPGSRFVIFTATPEQMKSYWLNFYFPQMLERSISLMPDFVTIEQALGLVGFAIIGMEKYFVQDSLQDNFLYAGKNRPQLYLDAGVRSGISSFVTLSNAAEVAKGLAELRKDIDLNKFEQVREKFEDNLGDYIFITAQKC